ncbi:hypothetical protein QCD58_001801 [Enterobacter hormaechei]|uniref:hypothetical protein n=1 Tax=Enterobacter sp. TaxID=42895 RepID=UPI0025882C2D|nr:hypothetical protein [Enterobacter sp.]EKS6643019.1 hypothetical protein [Enterobacter hormaechei]MBS6387185.1 hypothetical protein [Enterobacter sp.]
MSGMLASTAAAVGIIDKAVGIAKKLADDGGELDRATLKLELANLMTELASAKMEVVTTQMLLFDAEQKNKKLEEQLKDKQSYTFNDGLYWKEGDETAFCPKCYEVDKVQTHMVYARAVGQYSASWYCNNCRTCIYPNSA